MVAPQPRAAAAVGHGAAAGCGAAAGDDMGGLVGMVLGGCIKEELGGYDLQSQTRPLEESRRMSIFLLTKGVQCSDIWLGLSFLLFCKSYPARSGAPATRSWIFWSCMVQRSTVLDGNVFHMCFWNLIIKLTLQRSCLHGFWSGRTSPEDIQARAARDGQGFFPVGISNHAENAAMAISAIIPWLMADQHAAQLNST